MYFSIVANDSSISTDFFAAIYPPLHPFRKYLVTNKLLDIASHDSVWFKLAGGSTVKFTALNCAINQLNSIFRSYMRFELWDTNTLNLFAVDVCAAVHNIEMM